MPSAETVAKGRNSYVKVTHDDGRVDWIGFKTPLGDSPPCRSRVVSPLPATLCGSRQWEHFSCAAPSLSSANRSNVNPFFAKVRDSFRASASEIVFGMEDGAVSILGLVLGVATSARSSSLVLLAGAAGTAAASVSMMAGAYLGVESARDAVRVHLAFHEKAIREDPAEATDELMASLTKAGLGAPSLAAIRADTARDPRILSELQVLFTGDPSQRDIATAGQVSPIAHAAWMFASDLLAGLTPVVPFIFLALAQARVVSVALTLMLLLALGAGRARLAHRPFARTVLETVGVAALAAIAGVAVGALLPGV